MGEKNIKFLELGATMYMPTLNTSLVEVGNGLKYKYLKTVVFCTEDSVSTPDLPTALQNLKRSLTELQLAPIKRFIRPRSLEILKTILSFDGVDKVDGFILPKVDLDNLPLYFEILQQHQKFEIMLTIETEIAFDLFELYRLRTFLLNSPLKERIIAIRIGAMDLLSRLGLRREPNNTIYDTPLGYVIDQLITIFRPFGFPLAAPGCEYFDSHELLKRELGLDLARGLYAKTALHPEQVGLINEAYRVSEADLSMAQDINDPQKPAVFKVNGRMCEKTVHAHWANNIEARSEIFGIQRGSSE